MDFNPSLNLAFIHSSILTPISPNLPSPGASPHHRLAPSQRAVFLSPCAQSAMGLPLFFIASFLKMLVSSLPRNHLST